MPPTGRRGILATHPGLTAQEQAQGGSVLDWFIYEDEFFTYDSTATVGGYAEQTDGGTIAVADGAGGQLSIATGASDNDESNVSSILEAWLFATDSPIYFMARVKLTEANTDDANICVGLSDTVGQNVMVDAGAGPQVSYDGAMFYKVDGGTVWNIQGSNATAQDAETSIAAFTSGSWTWLAMEFYPNDDVTGKVTGWVKTGTGVWLRSTQVDITLSGLAEMHIILGVKAGDTNAETLLVDYVSVMAKR